jgi:hypothetical protein
MTPAISGAGTIIALSAFAYQVHRARFNQSVDLLFRLENDFFGPRKQAQRAKAAQGILNGDAIEAEPILDFFETMALLLRRKALDPEMVWHTFYYWIDHYYEALASYIADRRQRDPLTWKDFSALVSQVRRMQASKLHTGHAPALTADDVRDFLLEETQEAPS